MKEKIHGGNVYANPCKLDFSANLNPLGMPESVYRAAVEAIAESDRYPDPDCLALRSALAEREGVSEEDYVFGNGAAELILAYASVMKPKKALLLAPGFAEYEKALDLAGCESCFMVLSAESGFFPGEALITRVKEGDYDLLVLCNPNNPTGVPLPKDYLRRIFAITAEKGMHVLLDECFAGFLDPADGESLSKDYRTNPHVFFLKAFTKMYAMAGLRLGYGICAEKNVIEQIENILQPWNVSVPAQAAGVAAARLSDVPLQTRDYVSVQRKRLKDGLGKKGFTVIDGRANYLLFKAWETFGEQMKNEGILVRDCSNYRGLSKGWFRIAVRTETENGEFLETLFRMKEK